MDRSETRFNWLGRRFPALWLICASWIGPVAGGESRIVAITDDDLPANSTRQDVETHRSITHGILAALEAANAPAIGFVNQVKIEEEERVVGERLALLEEWFSRGHELGNHSYSHPSLYTTPLADYEADVLRGERALRPLLAGFESEPRYFRHPFLNTGPTVEIRDAFVEFLRLHRYRVAPVTIDSDEWIYARAYDVALDDGDRELSKRLVAGYLEYMADVFTYYEAQSEALLGRPIRHILLAHANRLNAEAGDELLAALAERGYRFVTLDEALEDPAYALPDEYAGRGGIAWLHRWASTAGGFFAPEPAAPDWVRNAARLGD